MKKVYIVMRIIDYEGEDVNSVWADEDSADFKAEAMNKERISGSIKFYVEDWEVQG